MKRMLSAPLAVLFEFKSFFDVLFVLARKVIIALAGRAFEFYKMVLRHISIMLASESLISTYSLSKPEVRIGLTTSFLP